jgi:hypothetical protein
MHRILAFSSAGVLAASLIGGIGLSRLGSGTVQWAPIFMIALAVTAVFAFRASLLLRKERTRQRRRLEVAANAMQELVDDMARLSLADLSIFIAAHQRGDENVAFATTAGSPNHRVLVQMTDLGLTAPEAMERIGDEGASFVFARYRLTASGRASIGNVLDIVARRRRSFASHDGAPAPER